MRFSGIGRDLIFEDLRSEARSGRSGRENGHFLYLSPDSGLYLQRLDTHPIARILVFSAQAPLIAV